MFFKIYLNSDKGLHGFMVKLYVLWGFLRLFDEQKKQNMFSQMVRFFFMVI